MKYRYRSESIDERSQDWSHPLRRRARPRWLDEHFGGSRSEQELRELDSRRDEARDRFGRERSEVRYERPVSRRRHHGFSGLADYGSNLGFSGGTASIGLRR